MSNNDDSDLDFCTGDTDECTVVRVQPSVPINRAASASKFKETKKFARDMQVNAKKAISHNHESSLTNYSFGQSHQAKSSLCIEKDYWKKTGKKISSKEITKRLYNFQNKTDEKVNRLVKQKEAQEMLECSFKPSILNKTKRRSIDSFLRQMQNYSEIKNKNMERIKEERLTTVSECESNVIKISKNSARILSKKSLLQDKKSSPIQKFGTQSNSNFAFQPKINEFSKMLVKEKRGENCLKTEKRPILTKSPPVFQLKTFSSPKSEDVLIKKFENEYSKIVSDLDFDGTGLLNYTKFGLILKRLYFISAGPERSANETELMIKAWKRVGGGENLKVSKRTVNSFLLAILNLTKKTRASSNDTVMTGRPGALSFSVEEVRKIHLEYHSFYLNQKEKKSVSPGSKKTPEQVLKKENLLHKEPFPYKIQLEDQSFLDLPLPQGLKENCLSPIEITESLSPTFSIVSCFRVSPKNQDIDKSIHEKSKPTLSIPKVAPKKSISLQRISVTPDGAKPLIKFSCHSSSISPNKRSPAVSMFNSESEITDQSLINPLITPPSNPVKGKRKMISFGEIVKKKENYGDKGISMFNNLEIPGSSKRYKCLSPESYEESEESILVTVILPNDTEQFLRIHQSDDVNKAVERFGMKFKLEPSQMKILKDEILSKLQ